MKISEMLKASIADGIGLSVNDGRVRATPTVKPLSQAFKDALVANKFELAVTISGERHWTNPKAGKRFVTRLAKCNDCGFACWGEVGNQDQWGCLVCRVSE
jgi:hypothetical protein